MTIISHTQRYYPHDLNTKYYVVLEKSNICHTFNKNK